MGQQTAHSKKAYCQGNLWWGNFLFKQNLESSWRNFWGNFIGKTRLAKWLPEFNFYYKIFYLKGCLWYGSQTSSLLHALHAVYYLVQGSASRVGDSTGSPSSKYVVYATACEVVDAFKVGKLYFKWQLFTQFFYDRWFSHTVLYIHKLLHTPPLLSLGSLWEQN